MKRAAVIGSILPCSTNPKVPAMSRLTVAVALGLLFATPARA